MDSNERFECKSARNLDRIVAKTAKRILMKSAGFNKPQAGDQAQNLYSYGPFVNRKRPLSMSILIG